MAVIRSTTSEFELKPKSFYFTLPGHLKSFNLRRIHEAITITFQKSFSRSFTQVIFIKSSSLLWNSSSYGPTERGFDDNWQYTNIQREYVSEKQL